MTKFNQVAAGLATVWKKPGLTQAAATLAAVLSTIAFGLNVHHKFEKAKTEGIPAAMKGTYDSVTGEDVNRIECTTKLSEKNITAMKNEISMSKEEVRKVKHAVNKASNKTATRISRLPQQMRTIFQEEIHSARKKKEALKIEKEVDGVTANPTHLEIARSKEEIQKVKHVVDNIATEISQLPEQMRRIVQEEIHLARKKEKESLKIEKVVTGVAANSTNLPMVPEEVQLKRVLKSTVHSTTVHDSPNFKVREGKDGGLIIVVSAELASKQKVQRKINISEVLKSLKELVKTDL